MSSNLEKYVNIRISRFEVYPEIRPIKYVVAFLVKGETCGIKYFETSIPLREANDINDVLIVQKLFDQVKVSISNWFNSSKSVLGNSFDIPESRFSFYASASNIESGSNIDHTQYYDDDQLSWILKRENEKKSILDGIKFERI